MQARIVNESSIRDLVASDVINRLKSDEDKAQQAVDLAQRNRTTAENDLRKFYRSTWNTTNNNNNNSNKEEVDEQLNQLRTLIGQRSEELKQAQSRLATIQNARHQHEQETLLQQQQQQNNNNNSQRRGGVYDDDNVGNLASLRNNLRHQQQQQHSNQQQLQELHARAAGNSLLTTAASLNNSNNNNNNNRHRRNLIAPSNMTASQQVHHHNQNNNINNNPNKSSSSLFDNTTAEDYVGGVLVPPATRVEAFHQNTTDSARAASSLSSSSSPTRVLATTRARMKKQSGKRRSRLDDLALSDEEDDDDYDEGDDGNRKNKKKSQKSKKQQQQRVKKEENVDDVPRIVKKEESSSSSSSSSDDDDNDNDNDSLFPSDEDSLDEPLDERVAQVIQPSADDLVPIRIIDNADYFLPKYVWNALLGYQQEAMRWFCGLHQRRVGGILGDEMGLGKTPMLSAYLHCLRFSGKLTQGPALIVAPLTVLAQWRRELQKWTPNMEVKILHSMEMGGGRGRGSTKQNKAKKNTTNNNRNVKVKKEEEDDDDDDVFDDEEFAGNENEFLLNGSSSSSGSSNNIQSVLRDQIANKPNVVGLTTYGTFARHVDHFSRCNFDFVALDEGHKISNPESMVTIAAKTIPTTNRYILSGSPIQNSLIEIWSLFDFCCPGLLGGASTFVSAFEDPIKASRNPQATPLQLATAVECARALRDQIAPFLLRRLKKDVNKMLPRKVEKAVLCPLSDKQLQSYVDILSSTEARSIEHQHYNTQQELAGLDRYGREKATGGLNLLGVNKKRSMRGQMHRAWQLLADLRSICNHVDIFNVRSKHREEKNNNNNNNGMMMMNTNNNNNNDDMVMLRASIAQQQRREQPQQQEEEEEEEEVERLNANKGKRKKNSNADSNKNKNKNTNSTASLSFRSNKPVDYSGSSKLTALMELLEQWKPDGHKVLVFCQTRMMLDIIENAVSQKMYRYMRMDGTTAGAGRHDLVHKFNHDQSIFVALLTTRVGGLGLNLTGADRVVLFDPDWNPVVDEQARERAWRIGQTREVHVYRLISSGTIEEHILHRQMAKMFVTEKVLSDPTLQRFFSIHSLVDAFRLGNEYADRVTEVCHGTIIANTISIKPSIKQELNTNHSQAMSIVDQHQHQHQQQHNGNNNDNNSNNKNTNTTTVSGAKVVADEHAQQAPERLQMDSSQSAHRMGGEYYCHSQQQQNSNNNNNNNNNRQSQPSQRSSSSMMNHHLSQKNSNHNVNNNNNNSNNNNMMMMMMPQQQQQQQQQNRVMMMMDDGSNNNNSNNNNNTSASATDPNSSTGLISSLVDGTKDEDGIMDKAASQTSIAAKRLAQLSALTTLKKALTNKNPDGTTFDDRIRLLPSSNNNNNNSSKNKNKNNNNTHRNNNSTASSSSSVWRR